MTNTNQPNSPEELSVEARILTINENTLELARKVSIEMQSSEGDVESLSGEGETLVRKVIKLNDENHAVRYIFVMLMNDIALVFHSRCVVISHNNLESYLKENDLL